MKKFIVVIIPIFKFYKVIFEDEFINGNEFETQNTIIKLLKLFGLDDNQYTCDLCFKEINK